MRLIDFLANDYVGAVGIIILTYVLVRGFIFFVRRIVPKLTAQTKTQWDDNLLQSISWPLTWVAMLIGARFAIGQISWNETYLATIEGILLTMVILFSGIMAYHVISSLVLAGFDKVTRNTRLKFNEGLIQFFQSILKLLLVIVVFLIVLSSWGLAIGPLLAGIGVAGIAVAFALQSTLANVFGGISLLLDRSIDKGDLITLDDGTSGKIVGIGLRSTRIKTFDNEMIIVPNGKLAGGNIKNLALPEPKTRIAVQFGVEQGKDVEMIKKLVLKEIHKIPAIAKSPKPEVILVELLGKVLKFKVYFYIEHYGHRSDAVDQANSLIYTALRKARVTFA